MARQVVPARKAAACAQSADGEAAEQPPAVQADGGPGEPHEVRPAQGAARRVAGDARHGVQPVREEEQGMFLAGRRGTDGCGLGAADCQRGRGGGAGVYWHSAHGHTPQSAASGCQLP